MTIGELIKTRREELGKSIYYVADRASVSSQTVMRIEEGKQKNPQFDTVFRILGCLDMSLSELDGYDPETRQVA